MDTVERVFFHELGHFVAHEINKLKYNRFGVESISLKRCLRDRNVWCGFCQPRQPVLNDAMIKIKSPEKRNLHFLLPSVMYWILRPKFTTISAQSLPLIWTCCS